MTDIFNVLSPIEFLKNDSQSNFKGAFYTRFFILWEVFRTRDLKKRRLTLLEA